MTDRTFFMSPAARKKNKARCVYTAKKVEK